MAEILKFLDDLVAFYLAAPPGGLQRAKVEQLFADWQRHIRDNVGISRSGP